MLPDAFGEESTDLRRWKVSPLRCRRKNNQGEIWPGVLMDTAGLSFGDQASAETAKPLANRRLVRQSTDPEEIEKMEIRNRLNRYGIPKR